MRKVFIILGLITGVLLLIASCGQYKQLTVEVQVPAKILIPSKIKSILLMNRSLTADFLNFNEDTLQQLVYKYEINSTVLDSTSTDSCVKSLGESLFKSGRFDVVIPQQRNIYSEDRKTPIEVPLQTSYVDSLCNVFKTDALIVLEGFNTDVETHLSSQTTGVNYFKSSQNYLATIDVAYAGYFRLYVPENNSNSEFLISDTIYWENQEASAKSVFENMPSIKECLIATGIKIGSDLADQLLPSWEQQRRGYFIIDKNNKDELQIKNTADWQKLINYWEPFTLSPNKSIRSKALYNIALANEMNGNIDSAIKASMTSYKIKYRRQTEQYLQKLKARKKQLEILNQSD